MSCPRCGDSGWICEQHPELPQRHDGCSGPGNPCPACNTGNPPRPGPGFVSFLGAYDPFTPPPPRQLRPSEPLFEFIRASDQAPMSCELRFHGESYGWKAVFLVRGELFASHGGFVTREAAVRWAERERQAFETATSY